jgi:hypothetical protein
MKGIYIMAISRQLYLNLGSLIMSGQSISQQLGVIKVDMFWFQAQPGISLILVNFLHMFPNGLVDLRLQK